MALKVAIVGCGGIGCNDHAPAYAEVDGVELVATCDLVEEKAKNLADRYGIPYFTNIDKMLESLNIDVVDVVTNEVYRPEPLMKALRAGKHVYCEKPLAGAKGQFNVEESDLIAGKQIMDTWRKSGKFFGIGFNYRTVSHAKAMKAAITAGEFGDPLMVNVFAHLCCWSHVIDLMRWFNGDVDELTAYMSPGELDRDRSATLKFTNGSIGTLTGTCKTAWEAPLMRIEYIGTKAMGMIEDLSGEFRMRVGDEPQKIVWAPPDGNSRTEFKQSIKCGTIAFATAVRDGKEPPVTGTDAYRELEIDAALPMSAARKAPVKLEHY
jgi:predicted dehydrogenase